MEDGDRADPGVSLPRSQEGCARPVRGDGGLDLGRVGREAVGPACLEEQSSQKDLLCSGTVQDGAEVLMKLASGERVGDLTGGTR